MIFLAANLLTVDEGVYIQSCSFCYYWHGGGRLRRFCATYSTDMDCNTPAHALNVNNHHTQEIHILYEQTFIKHILLVYSTHNVILQRMLRCGSLLSLCFMRNSILAQFHYNTI